MQSTQFRHAKGTASACGPAVWAARGGCTRPRGLRIVCASILALATTAAHAEDTGPVIAERFHALTRASTWTLIESIPIEFDTHHPQGMILLDDTIYLSSVEVIDRAKGEGFGHMFKLDRRGKLLHDLHLGEGPMYHPGGIDFDGHRLWVSVAEYRPDSRSIVYTVDPGTMIAQKLFEFPDHLGALVLDRQRNQLIGVNWGSRRFYRWPLRETGSGPAPDDPLHPETQPNGSHYIDYQDGHFLPGTRYALFGGLASHPGPGGKAFTLGGIELVNLDTLRAEHQVPVPLWSDSGRPMTQNPFYIAPTKKGLRAYFLPDDNRSTLYVYLAK